MPLVRRPAAGRLLFGAAIPWWRRSRRRTLRWAAATGLALLAVGMVRVRADDAARTLAGLGRTRTVVVARHDLEPGRVVGGDDTELRTLPVAAVPDAALQRPPTGRTVTAAIVAGEVISTSRLSPDGVEGLAALVPAGRRAIAVPTPDSRLRVRIDDRVDVLDPSGDRTYTVDGSERSDGSDVVARAAIVIAVDDSTVTVAVDQREAASVAAALGRGTPVLALAGAVPDP